ncbi:hypothetical protein PM032_15225 [Halorubrum ezzemoulense]|uniref:hypothetical protein n=1 Tax=Halorubrum ezzemoulense TaxID=337243 RepID=UPI00232DA9E9|nr:hypothetical protein [Halorubrum ezzemoulense]MDB2272355.1 hypothetical protein [Halorubrum ezzemoulense]
MSGVEEKVIVKGELHTSNADLNESIAILEEGVDHLIIEDVEQQAEYPRRYFWFQIQMWLLIHLFFNRIYTDHGVLEDIANIQDADITKTRESNSALIDSASRTDIVTSLFVFVTPVIVAFIIGVQYSGWWMFIGGIASFTLGMIGPPILLRMEESEREDDNRDEIIAEKITNAAETGGRVVAVIGEQHRQPTVENLPEWIDTDQRPQAYDWYHPWMLLNIGKAVGLLFTSYGILYAVLLFGSKFTATLV